MINPIFEDNHLLVVNKPAGLLTQPSGTEQNNLEDLAKQWIKEKTQKPGNVFLEAIHRLDKSVSGIVVFAKTSKALSRLMANMRERTVKKVYIALVENTPPEKKGTLEHYLVHDSYLSRVAQKNHPEAKLARLHYTVIKSENRKSLVEIELETGRYHQIRVQFSAIQCPIVGDKKYGSSIAAHQKGILLHHTHFEIPHPISKEIMVFTAACPERFRT